MPTVVIVHAAEDTLPARALAEKLRQAKLTVTLERQPGEEQREAVKGAQATIALWSPRSVSQAELVEDVQFAKTKSKVVHACMQSAPVPDQFRGDQSVNLTGWRGEDDFKPWRELADIVTKKVGVSPLPPPAQKPPSGFFQPGRVEPGAQQPPQPQRGGARPQQQQQQRAQPAPRPQPQQPPPQRQAAPRAAPAPVHAASEPRNGGGGRGMIIAIIAIVVIALGGGGYWFMTQNQGAHTTSLEDVDLGSAQALRAFIATNPPQAAREQAQQALATLEQQSLDAARDANTIEAFEQFLRDFPDSDEAIFVQGQIQQLRVQEANPPATDVPPAEAVPPGADPDLVPPGSTTAPTTPPAPAPAPDSGGPAVLTPPPAQPTP